MILQQCQHPNVFKKKIIGGPINIPNAFKIFIVSYPKGISGATNIPCTDLKP